MKRFLTLIAFLFASPALAQIGPIVAPGGGGSVAAGDAVSGCTIDSIVFINSAGNLACDGAVVQGSASTLGLAITNINSAQAGTAATDNFFSLTGTLLASAGGIALSGQRTIFTPTSSNGGNVFAGWIELEDASITNTSFTFGALHLENVQSSTGGTGPLTTFPVGLNVIVGNRGNKMGGRFVVSSVNAGAGSIIGVYGHVGGGMITGNRIGVWGNSIDHSGTFDAGGFFSLGHADVMPTIGADVALVADNVGIAANIFEARDNGTAVFTIADGGAVTAASYVTQTGILGELYETSGAAAITVTTAGTYYPWASTATGLSSNMTVSTATDDITATIAGKYRVNVACSMTATSNAVVKMRVFLEGVGQSKCDADRKISVSGDVGAAAITCMLQMAANDSLALQFTSDTNSDTVTPTECNMNASYIGN